MTVYKVLECDAGFCRTGECGRKKIEGKKVGTIRFQAVVEGWKSAGGMDYCPECYKRLQEEGRL